MEYIFFDSKNPSLLPSILLNERLSGTRKNSWNGLGSNSLNFFLASCPLYTISSKYYLYFAKLQKTSALFLPFTVIAPVSIPTPFPHTLPSCPLDTPQKGALKNTLQIFLAESHSKDASIWGAPSSQNTRPIMGIRAPLPYIIPKQTLQYLHPRYLLPPTLLPLQSHLGGRNCAPGGCTDNLLG